MPSARKQKRLRERNKRKIEFHFSFVNKKVAFVIALAFCLVLIVFSLFAVVNKKFWDGTNKLAVAVHDTDGASVLLFDPQYEEVVRIHIPEHTEVDVASGLGVWKIETLWQLGKQQGVGGKLLADTMTKYFRFPTAEWADTSALGLASGDMSNYYKAIFGIYSSNLSLGDRIALSWFSFNVPNSKHIDIDLSDTSYLTEQKLSDGSDGYVKVEPAPAKIMSLFADPDLAKSSHAISIQDATGQSKVAKNVGQVVEVLGAKVASISDQEEEDVDCTVKGRNEELITKVMALFQCKKGEGTTNFDVEILLGSQFAKRF